MIEILQADPFFSSDGPVTAEHVQTLSHMHNTRNTSSLHGTAERVEELFGEHAEAIRLLDSMGQAVKTCGAELTASVRALKKAKVMEEKEAEKERTRLAKSAAKAEAKAKEQEAKRLAAAAAKAKEAADKSGAASGGDQSKRRRATSRLAEEMCDTDPLVLKGRYPENQIPVFDSVVA